MTEPTTALAIREPDRALIHATKEYAEKTKALVVGDAGSYEGAMEALREIRTLDKHLSESRMERTRPIEAEKKAIIAEYKPAEDALKAADYSLTQSTAKWRREEEQKRIAAEREAAAKAERARQTALAKADEYREKGREDKAEQWEDKAIYTPQPVVASSVPKVAGVSTRTVWKFEIVDKSKLPIQYLVPNEKALQSLVDSLKGEHGLGDAIRVWSEDVAVARRIS